MSSPSPFSSRRRRLYKIDSLTVCNDVIYALDCMSSRLLMFRTNHDDDNDEDSEEMKILDDETLLNPEGLCVTRDSASVLVCDTGHHRIRCYFISANCKDSAVLAGFGTRGSLDGIGERATFDSPTAVCQLGDTKGTIAVADASRIRLLRAHTDGHIHVSTILFTADLSQQLVLSRPVSIVADEVGGGMIIADAGSRKVMCIRRSAPAGKPPRWTIRTCVGDGHPGNRDGSASVARFERLRGMFAHKNGSLFVCDNDAIRYLKRAGDAFERVATLRCPWSGKPTDIAALSDGTLVVADQHRTGRVRRLRPADIKMAVDAALSFETSDTTVDNEEGDSFRIEIERMLSKTKKIDANAISRALTDRGLTRVEAELVVACLDGETTLASTAATAISNCVKEMGLDGKLSQSN